MKKLVLLFPGQGSQFVGMGRASYDSNAQVRQIFDQASTALDIDFKKLCFDGPASELNSTENTQPAVLLCSVAAYRVFRDKTGLTPRWMAGHSLGELSALVCAEALSFEDGLRLARARGRAMAECTRNEAMGMSAVTKLERRQVEQICQTTPGFGRDFVIANFNTSRQQVISGRTDALNQVAQTLKAAGASVIPLRVSGPFHSPFMHPAAEQFRAELERISLRVPKISVISNVDVQPHGSSGEIAHRLIAQLTHPVRWEETMRFFEEQRADVFVDVGPGEVLKNMTAHAIPDASAFSLLPEDSTALERELGAEISALRERPNVLGKCLAVAVCTRNQNWDTAAYEQGVIAPYEQIQSQYETTKKNGQTPTDGQNREALRLLRQILETKRAPRHEIVERYDEILEHTGTRDSLASYVHELAGV